MHIMLVLPLLILSVFFITLIFLSLLSRWKMKHKYHSLPPGPFCWPLLGYLPFWNKNKNYKSLMKLADTFGGIFSLHVGSRYVVVIDDFEVLKDCYQREEFFGRPQGTFLTSKDSTRVGLTNMSGPLWKEHRKFWQTAIRHMTTGNQVIRDISTSQILEVVNTLRSREGTDVRVDNMLELAINNVSFYLEFGRTFPQDDNMVRLLGQYDHALMRLLELNSIKIFYPWLGVLISLLPKYWKMQKTIDTMDEEIRKEVRHHQQSLDENDLRNFVDLFLVQMQRTGMEKYYSMSRLVGSAKVLLASSSETTRTALVWFLMIVAKYPEIQEKIQEDIDAIVGREREPLLEDKTSLPFLEATIMESMRFQNVFHLNVPREVLWDTKVQGYDVPKDTIVFHNMRSHFRNPKYWKYPDHFDPRRFLSPDGKKIQVPEQFIPFSYGKRNCFGEKVATSTLFLFSAILLQKLTVKPSKDGINMNIIVNFTSGQEHPVLKFYSRF